MRVALFSVVVLMGCASAAPAPVRYGGPVAAPASRPAPAPAQPAPAAPTAPPDWADGPGVPLSAFALRPEEAQPFDPRRPPERHVVAAGDTLFTIAARYQTPLRALIEANRLAAPFALTEGQILAIPRPRLHAVRSGETVRSVAARYNVDARSLALLNRLSSPYVVRVGDSLVLPALARPRVTPPEAAPPPAQPKAAPPPAPAPKGAKPPVRLAWPTRGEVLARFGPQSGGRRSDGIDIAASPGAPVTAAGAGSVVYAGDDLPGYGNLVLIQHDGGLVTAYAQLKRLRAREGQRVEAGQAIADAGGRVHFQVRRAGLATDPLLALPPPV